MTLRLTSATVTFSVTWSSPMICSRLTIWLTLALLIGIVDVDAAVGDAAGGGLRILAGRRFTAA